MNNGTPLAHWPGKELEDPLSHLPCSEILTFRKGQTIYSKDQPSAGIYLMIDGMVQVSRITAEGRPVLVDIYGPDEFFGESALVGLPDTTETAVAFAQIHVMTWTAAEVERISAQRPKLSLALLQLMVQRSQNFASRIESFSVDNIARRLARTLIHFSERLGHETEDGCVETGHISHEVLSQYVGTSREIVTHYMAEFRRAGCVRYSRQSSVLNTHAMKQWLEREHVEKTGRKMAA